MNVPKEYKIMKIVDANAEKPKGKKYGVTQELQRWYDRQTALIRDNCSDEEIDRAYNKIIEDKRNADREAAIKLLNQ